jgi:sensor histidine kinase YesM
MIARFGILPAFLIVFILFKNKRGRAFIDNLPLKQITYLNIVRIPVEFTLYFLAVLEYVPIEMSFEGFNFDILAGISAPFIAYFGFVKNRISNKWVLRWNILSLLLLIFIIVIAILSAPSPCQYVDFKNIKPFALFLFPYVLLPTFIVPIVLFGHIVSFRKLATKE